MEEIKLKPFYDYEAVEKKAREYIERIMIGVTFFEHYGHSIKPTVFMSGDILSIIGQGSPRELSYNISPRIVTVCGYNVKIVADENVLSVGFDLL